ncbi:MAG: hypothetical protein IIB05_09540 [Bacteroidetes bacterium]|nr:hypothetical protein [Bacteroidota bacterium]
MNERNKIYQSRTVILAIIFLVIANFGFAQDAVTDKLPVRSPWTTSILIDNQTTTVPNKKAFDFRIHHRFGKIKNMADLMGIYAASNIRLGISYGITKKISIGFGTEKYNKMQEFQGKYNIISQTRDGKIPVAITYFGNIVIDSRDEEVFGQNYKFTNRLSFFNQIIVSRKFTRALTLQVAGSYSHFNAVTDLVENSDGKTIGKWKNDYIGVMAGGRYKFYNNISAIFEYSHPFAVYAAWEGQNKPLPNLGLGVEFGTSTHAFQVFVAQYDNIIAQKNYSNNLNDMASEGWRFGFNITVRF